MGLFSSTKTQVGTQVQRVIEDASLPNAVRDGVVRNLFDDDGAGGQMIEYVMDQLSNSIGLRAGRMYEYGKQDYVFGLPTSSTHSSTAGRDATLAAIRTTVGASANLSYYHFGPLNLLHLAWQALVQQYGYDSTTNQIGALSATTSYPVFLQDLQAVVTEASTEELNNDSLVVWGTPANAGPVPGKVDLSAYLAGLGAATPFSVDPGAAADTVRVDYCWEEPTQVVVEGITITRKLIKTGSLAIPVAGHDMLADYHQARYITSDGRAGYWIYRQGAGSQPTVDAIFDTEYNDNGTFFPFAYFRYNKTSAVENKAGAEYRSSKKLLNYLNMDFDTLATGINQNPDIGDVEQAMLMMAVPAKTEDLLEQRYLFDFFSGLQGQTSTLPNNTSLSHLFGLDLALNGGLPSTGMVIQDKRFKLALAYTNIVKRRVAGSFGRIGTYASGTGTNEHWYRHQVSEAVYEEVQVFGLKMTYWIFENYTTTGDENNEAILLIPLDARITDRYSIPDREILFARSLHYVFNSRVVTKLKWYQTGIFKALMVIAAIVVTVLSAGATWEAIVAAAAIGVTALATLLLTILLRYILINLAVKLFVKVVGVKFALIAAVIAAIAGTYMAIEAGSLSGAPWAKELLSVSTSLTSGIGKQVQSDFNDLLQEKSEFDKYVEDQTKLLEKAEALLNGNSLNPLLIFGETPNEFYQRTVHSGNIGVLGIDAITSYVDVALQLPKLSTTIGEFV